MFETIFVLLLLILLPSFLLALYGALVFRNRFGLVSPLWTLAIPVTSRVSHMVGLYVRDASNGWTETYKLIGTKLESLSGVSMVDQFVYIPALKAVFEHATYLLIILILLSDLSRLLQRSEIEKPRFLPRWSNRTTHIVGAFAVICYLLNDWFPVLALLLPDAT